MWASFMPFEYWKPAEFRKPEIASMKWDVKEFVCRLSSCYFLDLGIPIVDVF